MSKHSEDLLADLTDEEREAIESYDAEQEAAKAAAPERDPDPVIPDEPEVDPDADPQPEPEAKSEPDADPVADPEPAPEPEVKPEPVAKQGPVSAPVLIASAPEDAKEKLADIATQKKALAQKFEDGEITSFQLYEQTDALNDQKSAIERQIDRAELAQEMENQRLQNLWKQDVNRFLRENKEYEDPERLGQLDQTIMALARMPVNQGLANEEALAKAHKMVRAMRGEPMDDAPAAAAPAKPAQQKIPKPDAPPNIGNLPAAAMNDTSGGEFASLDRLQSSDPIAYEEKLMGMTQAQRDRYLRG